MRGEEGAQRRSTHSDRCAGAKISGIGEGLFLGLELEGIEELSEIAAWVS